jgi:hypothetical protein
MTKSLEHALLLLEKADEDLFTIQELIKDSRSPQAVIGFHSSMLPQTARKHGTTSGVL